MKGYCIRMFIFASTWKYKKRLRVCMRPMLMCMSCLLPQHTKHRNESSIHESKGFLP